MEIVKWLPISFPKSWPNPKRQCGHTMRHDRAPPCPNTTREAKVSSQDSSAGNFFPIVSCRYPLITPNTNYSFNEGSHQPGGAPLCFPNKVWSSTARLGCVIQWIDVSIILILIMTVIIIVGIIMVTALVSVSFQQNAITISWMSKMECYDNVQSWCEGRFVMSEARAVLSKYILHLSPGWWAARWPQGRR